MSNDSKFKEAVTPRTEDDILDAQLGNIESGERVCLGNKEYILMPKKRRHSRKFRKAIQPLLTDLQGIVGLIKAVKDTGDLDFKSIEESEYKNIAKILVTLIGPEFDELLDLVYLWSPEMEEDKELIEDTATDFEFITALIVIGKMVYGPLVFTGQMAGLMNSMGAENPKD